MKLFNNNNTKKGIALTDDDENNENVNNSFCSSSSAPINLPTRASTTTIDTYPTAASSSRSFSSTSTGRSTFIGQLNEKSMPGDNVGEDDDNNDEFNNVPVQMIGQVDVIKEEEEISKEEDDRSFNTKTTPKQHTRNHSKDVFNNESFRSVDFNTGITKKGDFSGTEYLNPPSICSGTDNNGANNTSANDISVELSVGELLPGDFQKSDTNNSINIVGYEDNSKNKNKNNIHGDNDDSNTTKMRKRRRVRCIIGLVVLCLFGLMALIVGVFIGGGDSSTTPIESQQQPGDGGSNDSSDDTTTPNTTPEEETSLIDIIKLQLSEYTVMNILEDESTPQGKALRQIIDETKIDNSPILLNNGVDASSLAKNKNHFEINSLRLKQRYALMVLYYSTTSVEESITSAERSNTQWKESNGWNNFDYDECNWYGTTCRLIVEGTEDGTNGGDGSELPSNSAVTQIQLDSNNLIGYIPYEICALSNYVEIINLSNNNLGMGSIPSCIFQKLISLEQLDLSNNNLSHVSPTKGNRGILAMNSKLIQLNLSNNKLSGNLNDLLFYNTNGSEEQEQETQTHEDEYEQTQTSLSRTQFDGPLHLQIKELLLNNNDLQGTIPDTFSKLPNLQQLTLHNNSNMEGSIKYNTGVCDLIHQKLKVFSYNMNTIQCQCCRTS